MSTFHIGARTRPGDPREESTPLPGVDIHDDERVLALEEAFRALDGAPDVRRTVVAPRQRAMPSRRESADVNAVARDGQAEAPRDVFDKPSLLPVGVLRVT